MNAKHLCHFGVPLDEATRRETVFASQSILGSRDPDDVAAPISLPSHDFAPNDSANPRIRNAAL